MYSIIVTHNKAVNHRPLRGRAFAASLLRPFTAWAIHRKILMKADIKEIIDAVKFHSTISKSFLNIKTGKVSREALNN